MNIRPWRRRDTLTPATSEFENFFNRFWGNGEEGLSSHLPELFRSRAVPAVNIAESEDSYSITMDCPGLDEEDFEIQTMGKQLLISGERKWEKEKQDKEYHRVESQFGRFERAVQLPDNARTEADAIEARYKKGILNISVPKMQKTPAAKIQVQSG